jgi:hypothetical protein
MAAVDWRCNSSRWAAGQGGFSCYVVYGDAGACSLAPGVPLIQLMNEHGRTLSVDPDKDEE